MLAACGVWALFHLLLPAGTQQAIKVNGEEHCNFENLKIGSWNVEGLTDLKEYEVCQYMQIHNIDIMYIQEIRKKNSAYYTAHFGFLFVLSGSPGAGCDWNRVGFVLAPRMRRHVQSFLQYSDRLCSLKIKIQGAKFDIICVYVSHNLKPANNKLKFYEDLSFVMGIL